MQWTKDQEKSIFASPAQIVVSAAAGSGKTQVLTTRITERLKDISNPVSVDRLLIVTFTKAAAVEMKERIGKSLRNAVQDASDPDVKQHLKKQLSLLGGAQICTIDSFCYDIVRQNFFKADLPSDISIGQSGELSLLKLAALEKTIDIFYCALEKSKGTLLSDENFENAELFDKYFQQEDTKLILSGFEMLTESFSHDKRDSDFTDSANRNGDFTDMIAYLYQKSQSAAYPEQWLIDATRIYNSDIDGYTNTQTHKSTFENCKNIIEDAIVTLTELRDISQSCGIGYEDSLDADISALLPIAQSTTYKEFYEAYKTASFFPALRGKKKEADKAVVSQIQSVRNKIKELITKKHLSDIMQFSIEESVSIANLQYPQIKALCMATILLDKLYYEKMISRHIIDFSTCEHLALKIISDDGITISETGEALKKKYDEIYIDEFQDSNNLQNTLFSLLSKGRTFMVGDVKQSIYGFRNANPGIFMKKCEESSFDENAENRKIFLSKNFRSNKTVINAVNSIFDVVMTEKVSKIDYKKEHRLDFGAIFIPENESCKKCEISLVQKNGNSKEQLMNEAYFIASRIKELISEKKLVWDKDKNIMRPVLYSDIVVLSRGLKGKVSVFETAFIKNNIPCYIDGGNDLYETNEVGQIIEILKLIDNEKSDISLACALRSPMFMFNETELLKIKLSSKKRFFESFYDICTEKTMVDSSLQNKCKFFYNRLKKWRKLSYFCTIEELILRIYNDTNIYSNVLSFPDGQMRRANLDLLLEKAEEFESSNYNGLFNFVNYISKISKTSENVSEAKAVSEKMNVVRIMTIHKSKGLEFPIVFLSGCADSYLKQSVTPGGIIVSNDAAIGINVVNPLLRSKYKSPLSQALSFKEMRENTAEEIRLLYVALTRAREKLYVVATLNGYDSFENMSASILKNPTSNEIFACNSYISLISLAFSHGADKYWNVCQYDVSSAESEDDSSIKPTLKFTEDKDISNLLNFEYAYKDYVNLPEKASVTLLKSIDLNIAPAHDGNITMLNTPSCKKISFNKPTFGKIKNGGTFFGNAHHKFLQYCDFHGKSLYEQLEDMLQSGIITDEEYGLIQLDKIEKLLESDLGKMLYNAKEIHREEAFVISVGANELNPDLDSNETICVQGIIDCFFEKDETTVVLVDYKTDKYDDPAVIAERYCKQLYYYEKALKAKYKDKIIQKYLYLIHKNDIIEM